MVKQELLDEKLVLEKTKQYKLSIQVSLNGFSFCCLDDNIKRFVALKEYSFTNNFSSSEEQCRLLSETFENDDLFKQSFKEVSCIYFSQTYTLIPQDFFIEKKASSYINPLISDKGDRLEVFFKHIEANNSVAVFALPSNIVQLIRKFHPNAKFYNQCVPQLTKQLAECTVKGFQLSILLNEGMGCLSLLENGELKVNNTFNFESTSDLIYYTLLILRENQANPEDVSVYVSGDIDKRSEKYCQLAQFLPNLAVESVPKGYEYSYLFKYKAEHQFANLFKLVECV